MTVICFIYLLLLFGDALGRFDAGLLVAGVCLIAYVAYDFFLKQNRKTKLIWGFF